MKPKPTVRVVSATEAKNKFGEIIKPAYASDEHLIVEKSGIPVVAIIPMADYQQLVGARAVEPEVAQKVDAESKRADAARRLKEVMDRVHAQMPPIEDEEEAERFIQQEVDAMRAEKAKRMLAEQRGAYSTRRKTRKKK
ncbi:MAG: type II toxin-antitoxin system prevent-host-death family antitoxin [Chloroflexota bacterium]|nr:type II toxin-antitoxin system prevent-host-death family antitoxin [Chloroflexota bacterium]